MSYADFLRSKSIIAPPSGIEVERSSISPVLFPFQRDLVSWAARKGRAALFTGTGTGKTLMQLEWARLIGRRSLIVAPLAVSQQTIREGAKLRIAVTYARNHAQAAPSGITVTNVEMARHFDPSAFDAVVLDESSLLKSVDGKMRAQLIAQFAQTPYRLCCTATPAPNDIAELANHAEFLGVMTRAEMLATWFVHDDAGWRLKGHARRKFFAWLSSWAMTLTRPSDIGYADDGYELPPLAVHQIVIPSDYVPEGQLFATGLKGVTDRAKVRSGTAPDKIARALDLVASSDDQWLLWCGLNKEQDALAAALGDRCVSVYGSLGPDEKVERERRWREGEVQVMVTKASVFGFGLNWQHCRQAAFVGINDSWEGYYQAIRRIWRFGQRRPVDIHVILTDLEEPILANILRKEREATAMIADLIREASDDARAELGQREHRDVIVHAQPIRLPAWLGRVS